MALTCPETSGTSDTAFNPTESTGLWTITGTAIVGTEINSIAFYIKRGTATSGSLHVDVYETSGTDITGSPIHTSATVSIASIGTSIQQVEFTFSTPWTVAADQVLTMVVTGTSGNMRAQYTSSSTYGERYATSAGKFSGCYNYCYGTEDPPSTGSRLPPPPIVVNF